MKWVGVLLLLVVMSAQGEGAAYIIRSPGAGGSGGNVSSVGVSYGLLDVGSASDPVLTVDNTTVCTSANGLCVSGGGNASWNESYADTLYYPLSSNPLGYLNESTGGGSFDLWRLGADSGSTASVVNNTLVRVLSGNGISTSITGSDVFVENTGVLTEVDPVWTSERSGYTTLVQLDNATICRSNGVNCLNMSDGTGPWVTGTGTIYNTTASVGIGTTSPTYRLHVNDSTSTAMNIGNFLYLNANNGRFGIGTSNPLYDVDLQDSVAQMRIRSTSSGIAQLRLENSDVAYVIEVEADEDFTIKDGITTFFEYKDSSNHIGIGGVADFVQDIKLYGNTLVENHLYVTGNNFVSGNTIISQNLTVDTDLYIDAVNDKIGIGTGTASSVGIILGGSRTLNVAGARGVFFNPTVIGDTTGIAGVGFSPRMTPTTNMGLIYGGISTAAISASSNDVTNFYVNYFRGDRTSDYSGTIANLRTFVVGDTISGGGSSTVTNQIGIDIQNLAGGTSSNVALQSRVTAGSGKYNIYATGSAQNYFSGNVGVGAATTPGSHLTVDAGTGRGIVEVDGSTGGCLKIRDTDDAGWTYCTVLNGAMSCSMIAC